MTELDKSYEHSLIESKWYKFWEEKGLFKANPDSIKKPFVIVIPPPNVTGVLHMGHALGSTLQDILIRYKRMSGFEALLIPGTDHAGIATQSVVEKQLLAKFSKKRTDFSREEFLKFVWQQKEDSETQILQQIKNLGCSCDWSRLRFSMDDVCNKAVKTMFKKMFDEGLIYRGDYLVNWDPVTQTALADDEVEYEERESALWYFNYPLEEENGFITVATTRPETMLGDTAVAVSNKDPRYERLIGKHAILPILNKKIPIIADRAVDPNFGTGAVKVTPAHDPEDYDMGIRHNLPIINIMTPDGLINENGGEFAGLTMLQARSAIVKKMSELGLLKKTDPHMLRVGISYRSGAVIEPYLSKQWFVKVSNFKKDLQDAVKLAKVKILPQNWEATYFHWIDNLRDWCISRQLWWGHRIPVWYNKKDPKKLICHIEEGLPKEAQNNPNDWAQDEDVLDTWFSSALWPLSTLGWPEKTKDLQRFYPISLMETGHDILFFWVARMILMGIYATGEAPFPRVFLHGLIYGKSYWKYRNDGSIAYLTPEESLPYDIGKETPTDIHFKWEKMSKTKGNVIDPREIGKIYGTDALRFTLTSCATHARQIDLDRRRFEENKHFINKVWNSARFILGNVKTLSTEDFAKGLDSALLSLEDKWILSRLNNLIKNTETCLEGYNFDQLAQQIYFFFWDEFCSYYLEMAKSCLNSKTSSIVEKQNKQKLLVIILLAILRIMHPIIPFITEEIFQYIKEIFGYSQLNDRADEYTKDALKALKNVSCMISQYPKCNEKDINEDAEKTFASLCKILRTIRNIKSEMQLPPQEEVEAFITEEHETSSMALVKNNSSLIKFLTRLKEIHFEKTKETGLSSIAVIEGLEIVIPLPHGLSAKEKARLCKERDKLIAKGNELRNKLANEQFVLRAPQNLVDDVKNNLAKLDVDIVEINRKIDSLSVEDYTK